MQCLGIPFICEQDPGGAAFERAQVDSPVHRSGDLIGRKSGALMRMH